MSWTTPLKVENGVTAPKGHSPVLLYLRNALEVGCSIQAHTVNGCLLPRPKFSILSTDQKVEAIGMGERIKEMEWICK